MTKESKYGNVRQSIVVDGDYFTPKYLYQDGAKQIWWMVDLGLDSPVYEVYFKVMHDVTFRIHIGKYLHQFRNRLTVKTVDQAPTAK